MTRPDLRLVGLSADRVVVVGESSPRGVDPLDALPPTGNSSGYRLMQITGLSEARYRSLCRVNLCAGRWSTAEARDAAAQLWMTIVGLSFADPAPTPWATVILLGRKVAQAFACVAYPGLGDGESAELRPWESAEDSDRVAKIVCLPHPSGLTRAWNPGIRRPGGPAALARAILRRAAPHVPWCAPWRRHVLSSDEPGAWLGIDLTWDQTWDPEGPGRRAAIERSELAWDDETDTIESRCDGDHPDIIRDGAGRIVIPRFGAMRVVGSSLVVRSRRAPGRAPGPTRRSSAACAPRPSRRAGAKRVGVDLRYRA